MGSGLLTAGSGLGAGGDGGVVAVTGGVTLGLSAAVELWPELGREVVAVVVVEISLGTTGFELAGVSLLAGAEPAIVSAEAGLVPCWIATSDAAAEPDAPATRAGCEELDDEELDDVVAATEVELEELDKVAAAVEVVELEEASLVAGLGVGSDATDATEPEAPATRAG